MAACDTGPRFGESGCSRPWHSPEALETRDSFARRARCSPKDTIRRLPRPSPVGCRRNRIHSESRSLTQRTRTRPIRDGTGCWNAEAFGRIPVLELRVNGHPPWPSWGSWSIPKRDQRQQKRYPEVATAASNPAPSQVNGTSAPMKVRSPASSALSEAWCTGRVPARGGKHAGTRVAPGLKMLDIQISVLQTIVCPVAGMGILAMAWSEP